MAKDSTGFPSSGTDQPSVPSLRRHRAALGGAGATAPEKVPLRDERGRGWFHPPAVQARGLREQTGARSSAGPTCAAAGARADRPNGWKTTAAGTLAGGYAPTGRCWRAVRWRSERREVARLLAVPQLPPRPDPPCARSWPWAAHRTPGARRTHRTRGHQRPRPDHTAVLADRPVTELSGGAPSVVQAGPRPGGAGDALDEPSPTSTSATRRRSSICWCV